MKTNSVFVACLLGAVTFSQPTYAQTEFVSTTVETGDLNLQSARGLETLEGRIARAARKVCTAGAQRSAGDSVSYASCIQSVKVTTARQIDELVMLAKTNRSAA